MIEFRAVKSRSVWKSIGANGGYFAVYDIYKFDNGTASLVLSDVSGDAVNEIINGLKSSLGEKGV